MDYEEEIDKLETKIGDIDYAIDKLEGVVESLKDIEECEEILGYTEDDVDNLKKIKEEIQEKIEDLEEQAEYSSDREERRKEFERSAI